MSDLNSLLSQHFGFQTEQPSLFRQALTHRSFSADHNEKLEFLGDAILGAVIANALFLRFPEATEGELSRLRANVVSGESLAKIAKKLGVGELLRLGGGELSSGGRERQSTLADSVEALIGAIYLESGFSSAESAILQLMAEPLAALKLADSKDPKTQLQEMLQAAKQTTPSYRIVKTEGAQHEQVFFVECQAFGKVTSGQGPNRRKAEQAAAIAMLQEVNV